MTIGDIIKANKYAIGIDLLISILIIIFVAVRFNSNEKASNKLIENVIAKQEAVHVEQERVKQKEIDTKLSTISDVRKENKKISNRLIELNKKVDANYLAGRKKIKEENDKEIKHATGTPVDTTSIILSRLLDDSIEE